MKAAVLLDNGFEELEAMGPTALIEAGRCGCGSGQREGTDRWSDVLGSRTSRPCRFHPMILIKPTV
jgi:hypothetical protein